MSQSSSPQSNSLRTTNQAILLEREDELAGFGDVLEDLGLEVVHVRQGLPSDEQIDSARLVLASAQRLIESAHPHLSYWPPTIVIVQNPSKTLSAHLHRIGATMILCQRIHPRALRLLLLHSIYRGPERRVRNRTAIGQSIRVGSGLFKSDGTLLELSPTGARIEMARLPRLGSTLTLTLGKTLTAGRPIRLKTRVVRCTEKTSGTSDSTAEVGLAILNAVAHHAEIDRILDRHADGPADWRAGPSFLERTDAAHPPSMDCDATQPAATSYGDDRDREHELDEKPSSHGDRPEKRAEARMPYERRIVALDREAARVLLGRDISSGGMRVAANENIQVDDVLNVALHCGYAMEPLVVRARALRDDAEAGLVLGFEGLSDDQRDHLEKIIAGSAPIRTSQSAESAERGVRDSIVLGEILECDDEFDDDELNFEDESSDAHAEDLPLESR